MSQIINKSLRLGIYPGGMTGTETGLSTGPSDQPHLIEKALTDLQGSSHLLIRCYLHYKKKGIEDIITPANPKQYVKPGRSLDLVLCFQSEEEDLSGWKELIRFVIRDYGMMLSNIQITEEANVSLPSLDGYYKNSRKALVEGTIVAKEEIEKLGLNTKVGFNATPDFSPDKLFWKEIASLASPVFYSSLDYVGIDFFPDVFRPVAPDGEQFDLKSSIRGVLQYYREVNMKEAGIVNNIPIHITENGWPTGVNRSEKQQALMLEKIIRIVHECRTEFNITHYELFDLRDADSNVHDIFYQFGIMRDDYTAKEAFFVYQKLINELSVNE